jgi:hypothetical protein
MAASRSAPCISSSSLSPPTLVYPLSPPSFVPMSYSFVMDASDLDASDDTDSESEIAATFFTAGLLLVVAGVAEVLPVVARENVADEL